MRVDAVTAAPAQEFSLTLWTGVPNNGGSSPPLFSGSGTRGHAMAQEWFYTKDGKTRIGPISATYLQALARSGQLLPTDMVREASMAKWVRASQIRGLFAQAALPAPAPLPVAVSVALPEPERGAGAGSAACAKRP